MKYLLTLVMMTLSFIILSQDTLAEIKTEGEFIQYSLETNMYETIFMYEQSDLSDIEKYTYVGAGNATQYNPVNTDTIIECRNDFSNLMYFHVTFANHKIYTTEGKWIKGIDNMSYIEGYYESIIGDSTHIIPIVLLKKDKT